MKKRKKFFRMILLELALLFLIIGNLLLEGHLVEPISKFLKDHIYFLYQVPNNKNTKEELVERNKTAREQELEKEIEELKRIVSLNETLAEVEYINALSVYRTMESWNQEITIDKGSKDGILEGMPAVTLEGLVGRVKKVSQKTSTIELLSSTPMKKVSVKIQVDNGYIYGILSNYLSDTKEFQIDGISENKEIPEGSIVTTTGMGEYYPAGIVVGITSSIQKDHFDLTRIINVKSNVNFEDLPTITILKRKDISSWNTSS